jgi:hypothetical protein
VSAQLCDAVLDTRIESAIMAPMSNAHITDGRYGRVVKINGRMRYLPMIESIVPGKDSYSFIVKHRNLATPFEVWGGKASGGRHNEWFIDQNGAEFAKVTSLMDALKMLNGM